MDVWKENWFSELTPFWPGQCFSLEIEKVLHHEKSDYQDIMFFQTKQYGRMFSLDGVIQLTERDEFSYQEMITFLPLNCHPNPKKVLVIGGGDGGVIREVVKHPAVESVIQCEIDGKVVELCKKYLPFVACGYDSPKLSQHIGDGFAFMKNHKHEFDVIITDSSDPIGPAEALFRKEYYELLRSALKPDGIICSLGEHMWLNLDLIKTLMIACSELYPVVDYGYTMVPAYPGGQCGFILCSLNPKTNFREPVHKFGDKEVRSLGLRYYNVDMHRASFVLPNFVKETLSPIVDKNTKQETNALE